MDDRPGYERNFRFFSMDFSLWASILQGGRELNERAVHAYCVAFARKVIDGEKYHSANRTIILSNEICDEVDDILDVCLANDPIFAR